MMSFSITNSIHVVALYSRFSIQMYLKVKENAHTRPDSLFKSLHALLNRFSI